MGIPNNVKESRHYMSQRTMMSLIKDRDTTPSTTNLFSIRFSTPEILRDTLKNKRYNNISTAVYSFADNLCSNDDNCQSFICETVNNNCIVRKICY